MSCEPQDSADQPGVTVRRTRRLQLTVVAAVLCASSLLLVACGGDEDSPSTIPGSPGSTAPPGGTAPTGGPLESYRSGLSDNGINFTTSPGGLMAAFNDLASDDLKATIQGEEVTANCELEDGSDASASGSWDEGASSATLPLDAAGPVDKCSLSVNGDVVAEADLEPIPAS